MKVVDAMNRGLDPVPPDTTVQEAAVRMATEDVGAVLVGTIEQLQGILTDRDILIRVVVKGGDPSAIRVADVMSSTLFTCSVDDTVESAFEKMRDHQVRRLPVFDEAGKPIGIVTLSDLAGQLKVDHEALRKIAEPHRDASPEAERTRAEPPQ
jgi:CBS domain-containing protein